MYSIGDFARFGGVSVRTLRYYEEVKLLMPAEVDPRTGYRSYEAHQLPRLHRIVALKDLGLSLEQLRPLLDGVSAGELRGMLQMKRVELEGRVNVESAVLARIENRLRYIEQEGRLAIDIVRKAVPELRVAAVRCEKSGRDFYNIGPFARDAFRHLRKNLVKAGVKMNGSAFLYYEETDSGSLIPTAAMEVGEQAIPHTDWINEVILPPIDVASTVYDGKPTPDFVGPVYGELGRWAEEHDYQIQGHGRDYCIGPGAAPESWIMELQMPIRRP